MVQNKNIKSGKMVLFAFAIATFQFSPSLLTSASADDQGGIASIYSTDSGRSTASGQRLNPGALTAAHRSLPFGSKVRVTNKSNGRSVVVTINDRGPFVRGRVIDLTPAGAHALGFSGLTRVTVARE
jgi:rare lipoprotein A